MNASLTRTSMKTKEFIGGFSGVLGFFIAAQFALDIYTGDVKDVNTATWLMVLLLDLTGLWLAWAEGNKKPWLQLGWVIAAILIMAAIYEKNIGTWKWGSTEIWSFFLCFAAVFTWQLLQKGFGEKRLGRIAGFTFQSVAIYVSFIPQVKDYLLHPQPETWYLWFGTAASCLMAIYAAGNRRDLAQVFIPWAAILLNLVVGILVIR